jgi:hypothetical protein
MWKTVLFVNPLETSQTCCAPLYIVKRAFFIIRSEVDSPHLEYTFDVCTIYPLSTMLLHVYIVLISRIVKIYSTVCLAVNIANNRKLSSSGRSAIKLTKSRPRMPLASFQNRS